MNEIFKNIIEELKHMKSEHEFLADKDDEYSELHGWKVGAFNDAIEVVERYSGIKDLKIIKPYPTEVITLFFNMENPTFEINQVINILDLLKEQFPSNEVIALPDTTSLKSCSKDVLENIISIISEVIEKL